MATPDDDDDDDDAHDGPECTHHQPPEIFKKSPQPILRGLAWKASRIFHLNTFQQRTLQFARARYMRAQLTYDDDDDDDDERGRVRPCVHLPALHAAARHANYMQLAGLGKGELATAFAPPGNASDDEGDDVCLSMVPCLMIRMEGRSLEAWHRLSQSARSKRFYGLTTVVEHLGGLLRASRQHPLSFVAGADQHAAGDQNAVGVCFGHPGGLVGAFLASADEGVVGYYRVLHV